MDVYLFGAKATAAGLFRALSVLELEKRVKAFLVSDCGKNVSEIWGCPVLRLSDIAGDLSEEEKRSALVYAAVPELVHTDIKGYPSAAIQHTWYVPEKDWELMMSVVEDLYPEYGERFDEVFSAPEFYDVTTQRYFQYTICTNNNLLCVKIIFGLFDILSNLYIDFVVMW